ncbi:MAG: FtsX-like permease family protein [Ruminococcaceae bacterium]|nr:FtsX-like permease family protein [Oscillospiraceae bacterium]
MKPSVFFYNLGQGFKGVFRNSVMTTASILVLIACMILVGTFYLVIDTIDRNFKAIDNLNVIEVMMDKSYGEGEILEIGHQLAEICDESPIVDWSKSRWTSDIVVPKDDTFKYVSPDEHFEIFKEMYNNAAWIEAIEKNDHEHNEGTHLGITSSMADNPLRGSYRITFVNLSDFDEVTKVKNKIDEITLLDANGIEVDAISNDDIKDHVELYGNVMSIKHTLYIAGLWLMAIFLLISLFVIMNTIKLGVFARRHEITFMRLCGATKSFIRMPFIVEGIIIGVFSALVSFGIEFYLYEYLLKDIISSATGTAGASGIISAPFWEAYALILAVGFLAIGLFAGIISSSISLKKYLKA